MKRQITVAGLNNSQDVAERLSRAIGEVRVYVCAILWAAVDNEANAFEKFSGRLNAPHPLYKHKAKMYARLAHNLIEHYEKKLLNPSCGKFGLFDLNELDAESRKKWRNDLTNADLFDYYKGIGHEFYAKIMPVVKALTWRYEEWLMRIGMEKANTIACIFTTNVLFNLAGDTFKVMCMKGMKELPPISVSIEQMMSDFNPKPIVDAISMLVNEITKGIKSEMSADEMLNITTSISQLASMCSDPIIIQEVQGLAIAEYSEIFASKKVQRSFLNENAKNIDEWRTERAVEAFKKYVKEGNNDKK